MSKPREFDLYFVTDDDGSIDPYSSSICENDVPWRPGYKWAEPDAHVIEKSAYDELKAHAEKLKARVEKLEALEQSGVDNWEGFWDAMELLESWRGEK